MHFLSTLAVSFLTLTAVNALPLQKRSQAASDLNDPADIVANNVEDGLEGFVTFLTGDSDKLKARDDLDLADAAGETFNAVGGFFDGSQGEGLKARQNIVDAVFVEGESTVKDIVAGQPEEKLKARQNIVDAAFVEGESTVKDIIAGQPDQRLKARQDNLVDAAVNGIEGEVAAVGGDVPIATGYRQKLKTRQNNLVDAAVNGVEGEVAAAGGDLPIVTGY